jgi:endonuclease/exonuclease/phosphatase (EEP) superfamily protein YafD
MVQSIQIVLFVVASVGAAGGLFATLAGFAGRKWWVFDLFSHFRLQYFMLLMGCTVVFLALGKYQIAAIASGAATLNLVLILPLYAGYSWNSRTSSAFAAGPTYRLALVNLYQPNRQHHQVAEFLRDTQPDILLLVEINQRWYNALQPVLVDFPYREVHLRQDNYGLALFSKLLLEEARKMNWGEMGIPTLAASLVLDGSRLNLLGAHPPPPKSARMAAGRNHIFAEMAAYASLQPDPVILVGDLNTTGWSPHFKDLLRESGLNNSQVGFGLQPSWPVDKPWLSVPIDHALVSSEVIVHQRRLGPQVGSDHYPLIIDFSIK